MIITIDEGSNQSTYVNPDRYYFVARCATDSHPKDFSMHLEEIDREEYKILSDLDDPQYDSMYNAICDRFDTRHGLANDWFFDRYEVMSSAEVSSRLLSR